MRNCCVDASLLLLDDPVGEEIEQQFGGDALLGEESQGLRLHRRQQAEIEILALRGRDIESRGAAEVKGIGGETRAAGVGPKDRLATLRLRKHASSRFPAGFRQGNSALGKLGPRMIDGRPIVVPAVLKPVTWPNWRKASGSARLALMILVRIISSRAFSAATS